ncbi:hypothetical protein LY76DRAFT_371977 [Colletotrichum caudatum]|nr:hypothetical protein LY76DRAFT_371977 [Colletotrichum caudatum]
MCIASVAGLACMYRLQSISIAVGGAICRIWSVRTLRCALHCTALQLVAEIDIKFPCSAGHLLNGDAGPEVETRERQSRQRGR